MSSLTQPRPVKTFSVYALPVAGSVRLRHRYVRSYSLVATAVDGAGLSSRVLWGQPEHVNVHTHATYHQLQLA